MTTILDDPAMLSWLNEPHAVILEVRMNQKTRDELVLRAGGVFLGMDEAAAIARVRLVIYDSLPWNVSRWVTKKGTAISSEDVPVFDPPPVRDINGRLISL